MGNRQDNKGISTPLIGVTQASLHLPTKRDLLLFDQVGIIALEANRGEFDAKTGADVEFLADQGAIFEAEFQLVEGPLSGITVEEISASAHDRLVVAVLSVLGPEILNGEKIIRATDLELTMSEMPIAAVLDVGAVGARAEETIRIHVDSAQGSEDKLMQLTHRLDIEAMEFASRILCNNLSTVQHTDVVPILIRRPQSNSALSTDTPSTVLEVVLTQFPTPDESVSWEQVLEFRQDDDASSARKRLRRWTSHMNKEGSSAKEILQELEYLLDEYEGYMKLHRMKTNRTTLESILVVGAEVLENLAKLRLGALAKSLFVLKDQRIALLEAEREAPGREVAYIAQARHAFRTH